MDRRIEVSRRTNVVFQGVSVVRGEECGGKKVCGLEYNLMLIVVSVGNCWCREMRKWVSLGVTVAVPGL
jgi:hypothetical protein